MFDASTWSMIGVGIVETLYMVIASTLFSYLFGVPLGVLLIVTDKEGVHPMPVFNTVLGFFVNALRSLPFIILLLWIQPFTRAIVGTTLGTNATMVPLVVGAAPFVARLVESSIKEVDRGVIEAAQSMGASNWQIVWKVMLPEARPSLLIGSAIAFTTILGYSAMSGFVGGGGLSAIAINYGYYRYEAGIMNITVIILVVIVQIFQEIGMRAAKIGDKRISA